MNQDLSELNANNKEGEDDLKEHIQGTMNHAINREQTDLGGVTHEDMIKTLQSGILQIAEDENSGSNNSKLQETDPQIPYTSKQFFE